MSALGIPAPAIIHQRTTPPRNARISPKVREAIRLMVDEGRSRAEAAKACAITDDWLYRAMERPECKALRNDRMRVLRESEASRTIARAVRLADTAESEHVQMQANSWLAGIEGIAPVLKTENLHVHQVLMPGLTVNREGWKPHYEDARVIDSQAHEAGSAPIINRIGQSVPHPSMRNATIEQPASAQAVTIPPENPAAGKVGGGGKKRGAPKVRGS